MNLLKILTGNSLRPLRFSAFSAVLILQQSGRKAASQRTRRTAGNAGGDVIGYLLPA